MDTSKIVGEKIKALREDKSISIEELAQRSGLAIEQIERIENNIDIPSLAPLIKIARVLGVRLGTFLDDQDEIGPVVCRKKEAKDAISFSNNAIRLNRIVAPASRANGRMRLLRGSNHGPFMIFRNMGREGSKYSSIKQEFEFSELIYSNPIPSKRTDAHSIAICFQIRVFLFVS